MKINSIKAAIIMSVGFLLIYSNVGVVVSGQAFEDNYPINNEWSNSGTHSNTFSDTDGSLVINSPTNNELDSGTFTSDIFTNGEIEINNIVYDANDITNNPDKQAIELLVRGVNSEGTVINEANYTLENGRYSVPVQSLQDEKYNGYQFVVNLETQSGVSPELNELVIQGEKFSEEATGLIPTAFGWLLVLIGLTMVVRDVF